MGTSLVVGGFWDFGTRLGCPMAPEQAGKFGGSCFHYFLFFFERNRTRNGRRETGFAGGFSLHFSFFSFLEKKEKRKEGKGKNSAEVFGLIGQKCVDVEERNSGKIGKGMEVGEGEKSGNGREGERRRRCAKLAAGGC